MMRVCQSMTVFALLVALIATGQSALSQGTDGVSQPSMTLSPRQISPNGDGVRDELGITIQGPPGDSFGVRVYDSSGKLVATLADQFKLDMRTAELSWSGRAASGVAQDGVYTIKASFAGSTEQQLSEKVIVDTSHKWPAVKYTNKPFFPIGVWFEGNPDWAGYPHTPEGAKAYYDRSFADVAAHGFNTVVVPNCPESLWETLLKSAQSKGVKVVLEVKPLVVLVTAEPITEAQVYAAAKSVYDRIGKYPSLLRYQIRDEPPPSFVPNWVLVQRILAAVDPSRPAFSCFCSPDSLAGVTDVTTLTEAVFDIYPLGVGAPQQSIGNFLQAFGAFQEAASGSTLWPVLQSFAKPGSWRYPTIEELSSMTYLSLAYGAKGVFDFLYQSMPNHPEKLEGLVGPQGQPTALYAPASDLAKGLKRLAPILMSLKLSEPVSAYGDARLGLFTDRFGKPVMIAANARPDAPVSLQVKVDSDKPWTDLVTGEIFTPQGQTLTIALSPGGGRVLRQ